MVNIELNTPQVSNLEQSYPNPFNPSTTITFSVPGAANVILKVYDILGTEVRTLINKDYTQGNYSVEFNAEGLSSGVYFYMLTAGNFSEVKKMQIMK